jgi:hypothetical protein
MFFFHTYFTQLTLYGLLHATAYYLDGEDKIEEYVFICLLTLVDNYCHAAKIIYQALS